MGFKLVSVLFTLMLVGPAFADPILHCQYGGTMILSVPRENYTEEPESIIKLVVWNGETLGSKVENYAMCEASDIVSVEYVHIPNNIIMFDVTIPNPAPQDLVNVIVPANFSVDRPKRIIDENSREIFYIYEVPLG